MIQERLQSPPRMGAILLLSVGLIWSSVKIIPWNSFAPRSSAAFDIPEEIKKLPPAQRRALLSNRKRYSLMPAERRRLIQDRWQVFRHMPPWRQEEVLRKYAAWKRAHRPRAEPPI